MICHSENILEVGQAWPNHNTMDSFYEHQEKTSMLKWMPCPVYCHLNLKAWEIHYPACMTHPVNQNSMKHMLLTAKVFFPFIFREGPRDSLPLGFFSVYLLNNQSLRWILWTLYFAISSFSFFPVLLPSSSFSSFSSQEFPFQWCCCIQFDLLSLVWELDLGHK